MDNLNGYMDMLHPQQEVELTNPYLLLNSWFKPHTTDQLEKEFYGIERGHYPKLADADKYKHFFISSGLQLSRREAEIYFWKDLFKQLFKIVPEEMTDIYWRRIPEIIKEYRYDENFAKYIMRCRFSLSKEESDGKD